MSLIQPLKTIKNGVRDIVYKDKVSKFLGFARHVENPEAAMAFFETLKKEHHGANHCCYAYRLGIDGQEFRANDDGEPAHSAGTPILGQIQSFGLTNTAVAVVRYFGGTKLGVGGLIKAYKTTAQLSLESCSFKAEVVYVRAELQFKYPDIGLTMQWLKQGGYEIIDQRLDQDCSIIFNVPNNIVEDVLTYWENYPNVVLIITKDQ